MDSRVKLKPLNLVFIQYLQCIQSAPNLHLHLQLRCNSPPWLCDEPVSQGAAQAAGAMSGVRTHDGNHPFPMEASQAGAFQRRLSAISNLRLCLMLFHNQLGFISFLKKKKKA